MKSWYRQRDLLIKSTVTEVRQKNAGSVLGNLWLVLAPVILMGIYAVVYIYIFKIRPTNLSLTTYLALMFSGLLPFLNIAEALTTTVNAISGNRQLLKNTVFPAEFLPLKAILSAQPSFVIGLLILSILLALLGELTPYVLLLLPIYLLHLMFLCGIGLVLSLLGIVLKDLNQLVTYLTMMLMIASPIAYTIDMLPSNVRFFIYLNPFAYFIMSFQYVVARGQLPPLHVLVPTIFLGLFSFGLGTFLFYRLKRVFISFT